MSVQLGSAYGKVSLDIKGMLSGITEGKMGLATLGEAGIQLGNTMRNVGAGLTLAVTLPIIAVGKSAIQMASAMNETKNKNKVVFGEMADDVEKWSQTSAEAFGQSQQQALEAAATFGNLFTSMKIGKKESSEMSMSLVQLASDLASFNDVDPSIALEKLRAGLVGEARPLREFGIRLSEAEVEAKALSMGLVQTSVDMTKVKGAALDLKVAQEKLSQAQRGGGVDADAVANAQSRVANSADAAQRAQQRLADAQTAVARAQRDLQVLLDDKDVEKNSLRVIHARERVADAEKRVQEAMEGVSQASRHASEASEKLNKAQIPEAVDALKVSVAQQKVAEAQDAVKRSLLGSNVELTEAQKLQARYALIMEQSANAQGDFARTSDDFANSLRTLQAYWGNTLVIIGNMFLPLANKVVHILIDILSAFQKLTPFQQKMITGFFLLAASVGPILVVLGVLVSMIFRVITAIGLLGQAGIVLPGLAAGISSIGTAVTGLIPAFGALSTTAVPAIGAIGAALLPLLPEILLVAAVVGLLYYAWKKNLFGIQELVARSAAGYRQAWQRFTDWWKENTNQAGQEVHASMIQSSEGISAAFVKMGTDIRTSWQSFTSWLSGAVSGIANWISKSFSSINWGQVGKNILFGLANGLLLGLPALLAIVVKVAQSVLAQIKKSLGISSPSKEAMKLGAFTAQGFALGMQTMSPEAITRSLTKPITQNSSSQQQVINMNIAGGLTTHQVRGMIEQNNEVLMNTMIGALSNG